MIQRSGWLDLALVATLVGVAVWLLFRIRRRIDAATSLHLLVNSVAAISVLIAIFVGYAAVEILIAPAIALQAIFRVDCLPTDGTIFASLFVAAFIAALCEFARQRS